MDIAWFGLISASNMCVDLSLSRKRKLPYCHVHCRYRGFRHSPATHSETCRHGQDEDFNGGEVGGTTPELFRHHKTGKWQHLLLKPRDPLYIIPIHIGLDQNVRACVEGFEKVRRDSGTHMILTQERYD